MKNLKEYSSEIFNFLNENTDEPIGANTLEQSQENVSSEQPEQSSIEPTAETQDNIPVWTELETEIKEFQKQLAEAGFNSINEFLQSLQTEAQPNPEETSPTDAYTSDTKMKKDA